MKATILLLIAFTLTHVHGQTTQEIAITKDLHFRVNTYRQSLGLNRLNALKALNLIARQHSQDMADGKVSFSHTGFNKRVQRIVKGYRLTSYKAAENLFMTGYQTSISADALKGWINSPGHKVNLEGNFNYTGIGVVQADDGTWYITQIYVRMKSRKRN